MFATHSHSEAQWNESGWFVDQALPPHIEPNHLDPMELAGLCSAPWLRRGVASLRGAGERTCAYIGGHTQRNMQWPQKFGSCHKAGMLVFHHESWPCYGCILFMPWKLLQFNITIDKGVVGTLIHIIGNSYQLSYSFSIIVKSLSKMWQPLASTFCSHRIGSLECQCFGCQKMSTPANLQSSSPVGSLATSAAGFLQPLGLVAVRTIFYALLAPLLSFWFIFEVVQLGAFFDCYHIGKDWNGDSIHLHGVPHHVDQFWIFTWLAPKEWNNATLLWIVKILDLLERLDDHLEAIELDGQLVVLGQGTGLLGNDLTKWDQLQTILLGDLGCGEQAHGILCHSDLFLSHWLLGIGLVQGHGHLGFSMFLLAQSILFGQGLFECIFCTLLGHLCPGLLPLA